MNKALVFVFAVLAVTACTKSNDEKFDGVVRDAHRGEPAASQPTLPASSSASSSHNAKDKFDDILNQARKKQ